MGVYFYKECPRQQVVSSEHCVPVYEHCAVTAACRLTVHRLAARTVIRSLEMQERAGSQDKAVKRKAVELSVQSGVSSTFTAFIAVNQEDGKTIDGPLLRRDVPTAGEHCGPVIHCSLFLNQWSSVMGLLRKAGKLHHTYCIK